MCCFTAHKHCRPAPNRRRSGTVLSRLDIWRGRAASWSGRPSSSPPPVKSQAQAYGVSHLCENSQPMISGSRANRFPPPCWLGGAALLKVVRVLDVQHQQPADLLLGQSRCCLGLQKPRSVQNRTGLLVNILFRVCFLLRKPPPFSSSFPFFRKNPCPAAASPERKQRRLLLPQKGRLTGQTGKTA